MIPHDENRKKTTRPLVFDMTSNQCVWAGTGLMAPFPCMNAFNCLDCPLDRQMRHLVLERTMAVSTPSGAAAAPKPATSRDDSPGKCRHMLSGRVSYKYCMNRYDCAGCDFHQSMEEEMLHMPVTTVNLTDIAGFRMAERYYHHRGHAWARIEYGGRVRVGMDDFSMRLLGPADGIELPGLGTAVLQGSPHMTIRRNSRIAEALCPVDGIVVAVNPRADDHPSLANQAPYDAGWLMIVEPTKLKRNLKNLMFGEESLTWMEGESSRLTDLVAAETGYQLAATGGRAVHDIYGQMPELGWDTLVKTFLLNG